VLCVGASPFRPPVGQPYRAFLRSLHRRNAHLFVEWARQADGSDYTLVGDPAETIILYDALCRVAISHGFWIGEPVPEEVVQQAEHHLAAPEPISTMETVPRKAPRQNGPRVRRARMCLRV
jgi:hypothetical protein